METRSNRLLVLAIVGVLLATLVLFAVWLFSGQNPDGREYLIRFDDNVTGVSKGSPVTYSGVPAGSVTAVRLAEADPSTVLVHVRLDPDIPIVRGVEATVSRSFMGGESTISLDGGRKGAPPIVPVLGEPLPVIPAKSGGLLGSSGDPMALIEKISRSVDNVSDNLDAQGQARARARLGRLAEKSAYWSDKVPQITDGLTGTNGRVQQVGRSIARAGDGAGRLRTKIEAQRGSSLRVLSERLRSVDGAVEAFGANVEAARPSIRGVDVKQHAIMDQVRAVSSTTKQVEKQAEQLDREGLQPFGTPKLPDYKPEGGVATPSDIPPPSR